MIKRCKHEYWSVEQYLSDREIKECCHKCGAPKAYPSDITYGSYLKEVSKRMFRAWLSVKDAYDIIDFEAGKDFFVSLAEGVLAFVAILIMPFLFPFYPLIAAFALWNHKRLFRKRVLGYFEIWKAYDYDNYSEMKDD